LSDFQTGVSILYAHICKLEDTDSPFFREEINRNSSKSFLFSTSGALGIDQKTFSEHISASLFCRSAVPRWQLKISCGHYTILQEGSSKMLKYDINGNVWALNATIIKPLRYFL
jgi:hypothetical protein